MNDDGQWIMLMAFIICIGMIFLAILLNQSILVGQTTAEAVLEFPKANIQDLRNEIWVIYSRYSFSEMTLFEMNEVIEDIQSISLARKTAVVRIEPGNAVPWMFHYNDGITEYTEEIRYEHY